MNDERSPARKTAAHKLISLPKASTAGRRRESAAHARLVAPLVWECDACRGPVADGAGWLTIRYDDIGEFRRAEAVSERKHSDGWNLLELPRPVVWHVWHKACDPDIGSSDYCIDIERIRSVADLLEWTSHLMENTWLPLTTWRDVLRDQANALRRDA